jgi:phospholipid/cholesterol/gamma-HCH transport system permease protein
MPASSSESPEGLAAVIAPRLERVGAATDHESGSTGWRLTGAWTAGQLGQRSNWRSLDAALSQATRTEQEWDLTGAEQIDHIGAQLLWNRWGYSWPAQVHATDAQRALLDRVAHFTVEMPTDNSRPWMRPVSLFGAQVLAGVAQLRSLLALVGQLLLDTLQLLRAPRRAPWRDFSGHLFQMGAAALPITALVGFLIGVVLAYLMSLQLRQYGAEAFIVNILGVSLVRELGPMLAAILVAGRSGSAITAQIGVMRVTEEIDAMRVMGISETYRLVMPRAIALAVAMPLIGVWTTLASLIGGMVAADVSLGITPGYFISSLPEATSPANLGIATVKCVVFGALIALVGCHYGMRVKPNTESLGKGTTSSVVAAITVVILVDALFAIVFRNVGI